MCLGESDANRNLASYRNNYCGLCDGTLKEIQDKTQNGGNDCDDGDFCTRDFQETTNCNQVCTYDPVSCYTTPEDEAASCDPFDGTCQKDSQLIPCVAVIDRDIDFGSPNQATWWKTFRNRFPKRPFCLLVPNPDGSINTPTDFKTDARKLEHYNVRLDNGNPALAEDWANLCNLSKYSRTKNVKSVKLLIVERPGVLRRSNVSASVVKFQESMNAKGIGVETLAQSNQNWISPFVTEPDPSDCEEDCIDNDFCTIAQTDFVNGNCVCSFLPVQCPSPGTSCNPVDGLCYSDDDLVPCVAVIDEDTFFGTPNQTTSWALFRNAYPKRLFCLLIPDIPGRVNVPGNFVNDSNQITRYNVRRDNGVVALAEDWVDLCGLSNYTSVKNVGTVAFLVVDDATFRKSEVAASLTKFKSSLNNKGISTNEVFTTTDNWIEPFRKNFTNPPTGDCDDGDLCTQDQSNFVNGTRVCSFQPVQCPSAGTSCNPVDGRCYSDDDLVPCVAVLDEDSSFGTPDQTTSWALFRNAYPKRPFCLLVPDIPGSVNVPRNFVNDSNQITRYNVRRDNGVVASAEDWVDLCGLSNYTSVKNVGTVAFLVVADATLRKSEIGASLTKFRLSLNAKGISTNEVFTTTENWIEPFKRNFKDPPTGDCDDGDLCTQDQSNFVNGTRVCSFQPVQCPIAGTSCNPVDGRCYSDDDLVPCVAVIDEDTAFGTPNQTTSWALFRNAYPKRPFCLLVPYIPGSVNVPGNFVNDSNQITRYNVQRDNGIVASAEDWVDLCGLSYYTSVKNVGTVAFLVVDDATLRKSEVAASLIKFRSSLNAKGISTKEVLTTTENWIEPFRKNFTDPPTGYCDDGDLCTQDQSNFVNGTRVCSFQPVQCSSAGTSCNPVDGRCYSDDDLVPCVAVLDEDIFFGTPNQTTSWALFRNDYPKRPFCLLVPDIPGSVNVPRNFVNDSNQITRYNVRRDNGVTALAEDWVDLCGLSNYTSVKNVGTVAFLVVDDATFRKSEVAASLTKFKSSLNSKGIFTNELFTTTDNWIETFRKNFTDPPTGYCDDGDLCTQDQSNFVNGTRVCSFQPVQCPSAGTSCNPVDGRCYSDDDLVPCVAVIDEDIFFGTPNQTTSWALFRNAYPKRPFCLLVPDIPGSVNVPRNFVNDSNQITRYNVRRDNGVTALAEDWVDLCGLSNYTSVKNVGTVAFLVVDDATFRKSEVAASLTKFKSSLSAKGISTNEVFTTTDNWIEPFKRNSTDPPTGDCYDGDLCTQDQSNFVNGTRVCSFQPVQCPSAGTSCNPVDGRCYSDDDLVPCVAVIDEDTSFGTPNQTTSWGLFRNAYPKRPFCLLIPDIPGSVNVPGNFVNDSNQITRYNVRRDNGVTALAEDWVDLCGLSNYTSVKNVGTVAFLVVDDATFRKSEVAASLTKFKSSLNSKGIFTNELFTTTDNWIETFRKNFTDPPTGYCDDGDLCTQDQSNFVNGTRVCSFQPVQCPSAGTSCNPVDGRCYSDDDLVPCVAVIDEDIFFGTPNQTTSWALFRNAYPKRPFCLLVPDIPGSVNVPRNFVNDSNQITRYNVRRDIGVVVLAEDWVDLCGLSNYTSVKNVGTVAFLVVDDATFRKSEVAASLTKFKSSLSAKGISTNEVFTTTDNWIEPFKRNFKDPPTGDCDDGDLCTQDQSNFVNGTRVCSFQPVQCPSAGTSCNPVDGRCYSDDDLVPCVAVIDEDIFFGTPNQTTSWALFRNDYPKRPFCLLVPDIPGSVNVPRNFVNDSNQITRYHVRRDNGVTALAEDWVDLCGLSNYTSVKNVGTVAFLVVDDATFRKSEVAASLTKFKSSLSAKGISTNEVFTTTDNWIEPFKRNSTDPPTGDCYDGDLCTQDQSNFVNGTRVCSFQPVQCPSAGTSCNPVDGRCYSDDDLVPCVAVIDEDTSFGTPNQTTSWGLFRNAYPKRPFCLLIPEIPGSVNLPRNFVKDFNQITRYNVRRDNGVVALAEDWVDLCGLSKYTSVKNVGTVALLVVEDDSLKRSEVAASLTKFRSSLNAKNISTNEVFTATENWIEPFTNFTTPPGYCDDGDLCTQDQSNFVNGTRVCSNLPVQCPSAGTSCNPVDGLCYSDDDLVPCVAVIDEDDNFGTPNQTTSWALFRNAHPNRPFCLLVPGRPGRVNVPRNFVNDSNQITRYNVRKDLGVEASAEDWVDLCGLSNYTSVKNVGTVAFLVVDDDTLQKSEVAASLTKFKSSLNNKGISTNEVFTATENWIEPFTNFTTPPGDCDDGDLCTQDQSNFVNGTRVCSNLPVQCPSAGTSCNPVDGLCYSDDDLVPCVAVIDEDSSFGTPNQTTSWALFRNAHPNRPFCLLIPDIPGSVNVARNFVNDSNQITRYNVRRDIGVEASAEDWVDLCGLSNYTSVKNVGTVAFLVVDDDSLQRSEVAASLTKFKSSLNNKGISVNEVFTTTENWIEPFTNFTTPPGDCYDGDLCTQDQSNFVNGTRVCSFQPVQCPSAGTSCNPVDGRCYSDYDLVPCVAVIDEDDNFGIPDQTTRWTQFRSEYPNRPFCLLVTNPLGSVNIPRNFANDSNKVTKYDVPRDKGNATLAEDWADLCNLLQYSSVKNVGVVELYVKNVGNLTKSDVSVSLANFRDAMAVRGIVVQEVITRANATENWILPFIISFNVFSGES
ncbi:hypothetical protein ACA910_014417 [Epithemia clementina (nom. ined.)]